MFSFALSDLSIRAKFMLVGALALAMTALPAALVLRQELHDLSVARGERAGVAPAAKLLRLVQLTQQHRGLSAAMLGGNAAAGDARAKAATQIEAALADAEAAVRPLGGDRLAPGLAQLRADWTPLAGAVAARSLSAAESFGRHTALITRQLATLEDVVDASGMSFDDDRASYNLIHAVLVHLPELTEWLGQARGRGANILARGEIKPEERLRLGVLVENARNSSQRANKLLQAAMQQAPHLRTRLGAAVAASETAVEEAARLVDSGLLKPDIPQGRSSDYFGALTRHIDAQFALIDQAFAELDAGLARREQATQRHLALALSAITLITALALGVLVAVARRTTRSLHAAVSAARQVASGNLVLALDATARDETGELLRALQGMSSSLAQVVQTVRGNAESVAAASGQIAQGNADLSQRTEEQASALQQTAATMEQLGATVRQNADNAREADRMATGAREVARRGGAVVGEVVATMQGISGSSRRIADITGVIDGIAFQTNILALNAAVEAARAGDQGRGFAVVAGEVRLLAQRSAAAAKEINALIGASVEQVSQGSELVARAGATMDEVVAAVQQVGDRVAAISGATEQQHGGVALAGEAIGRIDEATQQNAALVEESAAAAESLRDQADRLVKAVSVFRVAAQG